MDEDEESTDSLQDFYDAVEEVLDSAIDDTPEETYEDEEDDD